MSNFEKLLTSSPIDSSAASVISSGYKYKPAKKVLTSDSDLPIKFRQPIRQETQNPGFHDLSGFKFGLFTVLGVHDRGHEKAPKTGTNWVVRCICGRFSLRKAKAIKNTNNNTDCCEICRHNSFLRNRSLYKNGGSK